MIHDEVDNGIRQGFYTYSISKKVDVKILNFP